MFEQGAMFLQVLEQLDEMMARVSPSTGLILNEMGVLADQTGNYSAVPQFYFASAAWFAWMWGEIAKVERVEAVGQSTFSLADPAGVPKQPTSPIPCALCPSSSSMIVL